MRRGTAERGMERPGVAGKVFMITRLEFYLGIGFVFAAVCLFGWWMERRAKKRESEWKANELDRLKTAFRGIRSLNADRSEAAGRLYVALKTLNRKIDEIKPGDLLRRGNQ